MLRWYYRQRLYSLEDLIAEFYLCAGDYERVKRMVEKQHRRGEFRQLPRAIPYTPGDRVEALELIERLPASVRHQFREVYESGGDYPSSLLSDLYHGE